MTLEEYKNILITGTPSDRARAIAEAGNDRSLTDEEFHELTAMIKGVVRPGRRKMTPDEAKLWAEVSRINTRLKDEMVNAGPARRPAGGCDQRSFPHGERDAGRPDRHDGRDRGAVRWTAPSVYMCLRSPGAGA